MQGIPLKFQEMVKLSSLEIENRSLKFGVTCLESDKYLSVVDNNAAGESILTVVELQNNFKMTKKPNKGEAAIMHPSQNIISVRARKDGNSGTIIQIFNLDTRDKLKHIDMNEVVIYWRWASNDKLALVTSTAVYIVNLKNPNENEVKLMDRSGNLADPGVQIINFALDPYEKWASLTGINSPDGGKTINGNIQLFLIDGARQQLLQGHYSCFGEALIHNDQNKSTLFCFVEKKAEETTSKIQITEISTPPGGFQKHKKLQEIQYSPDFPSDFPIYMQVSGKLGILYVVTKYGFLYLYEITRAALLIKTKISQDPIFIGARNSKNDGVLAINKQGSVLSICADETLLIQFIMNQCKHIPDNTSLASMIASRYQLPGAENIMIDNFNRSFISGDFAGASKIAAACVGLRNIETINRFKSVQANFGQPQPVVIYFQSLIEKGKLKNFEAVELVTMLMSLGKTDSIEALVVNEDKLECSEQLGDLVKSFNPNLATKIYEKAGSSQKLVQSYMETGQFDKVMQVSQSMGVRPDYVSMLRTMIPQNPEGALMTAKNLFQKDPSLNVYGIAEVFLQYNRIQELTGFLVECMKKNLPEDGEWQTKVLKLNLAAVPSVAETILQMGIWTKYNRQEIALMCEQKGMFQRALENYTELKDIRRAILNTHMINQEFLVGFLSSLPTESALVCLTDLIRSNRQNFQIVVRVCITSYPTFGVDPCIKIFESVGSFDGLFMFLGAVINHSQEKEVFFKYIEAGAKCNQLREIEKVIREKPDFYDPIQVRDFFINDTKLSDPKPLILLCDIHGYVEELIKYLCKNNFTNYIQIYLFKVNLNSAPIVMGTLMDLEYEESYIKTLLFNLRANCPMEGLIEEFEKRNKLIVMESWLEARMAEGNQLPALHNALAKLKIDTNQNPQDFLINNQYYDSKVVGKYCEERDPHLAYTAYKKAWGQCDMELIEVTNKNSLYRLQARYLVERQSKELWAHVLSPDNPHKKAIVEQVVSHALPDSKNVEEVSTTVQAFMSADLPNELISLLEKIVLHNSEFGQYKKLQNLLIITAIKADKTKVMDYINRLDNYDAPEIATIALGEPFCLYEEAFVIYKKKNYNVEAIDVLLNNIESIPRALDFAEKTNEVGVWSKLGNAYLEKYHVVEAIDCYIKAGDHTTYGQVIGAAENEGVYEKLIKYLLMARSKAKDPTIDNSLVYAYSKLEKIAELEDFLSNTNSTDCARVGDRCYAEKLYVSAKILFTSIKNNAKIASCLVRLKEFQKAIECAKKANTPKTWKEVCIACVEAQEFRLAAVAGLNIIVHPDHLEELIKVYESHGVPDEIISLLLTGMASDRPHIGIYTELGVLYAKYQPAKLMEHCKQYFVKLNVSKLLRVCERYMLWPEAVFLYSNYEEYDNALMILIEHSPSAFNHDIFTSVIQKVANTDLYYKAMAFYIEEQPLMINDLLKSIATKIDLSKTVYVIQQLECLDLVQPFLKSVQTTNNPSVNEALNNLYLEEENYEELLESIKNFENFDPISIIKKTEKHESIEFRRIAAFLYRKAKKFEFSIELSKQDGMFRDAIETALESKKPENVENLMRYLLEKGEKEFFTVCIYTCYELLKPDVVMELAWRFGMIDFAMPFFIQITRELTHKVENVEKKNVDREKKEKKQQEQNLNAPIDMGDMHMMMNGITDQLMIGPPPGTMPGFNSGPPMMGGQQMGSGFGGGMPGMMGGINPNMGPHNFMTGGHPFQPSGSNFMTPR